MFNTVHAWMFSVGKTEDLAGKLRSVLAQLDFAFEINRWTDKGVPFSSKLYVPEVHPTTQVGFCEREDEGHVLKVWKECTVLLVITCMYTESRKLPTHGSNCRNTITTVCGGTQGSKLWFNLPSNDWHPQTVC